MSKKIKITESQLKMIMERKHSYMETKEEEVKIEEPKEEEEECKECGEKMEEEENNVLNEQIEKIKSDFRRYL